MMSYSPTELLAGCAHPEVCQSRTVWGWFGQECERMGCDMECGEDEHLCDAGYDMDGNSSLFDNSVKGIYI